MDNAEASGADPIETIARQMVEALVERLGDKVELVFAYGSRVKGNTHRFSDLDFSFVPTQGSSGSNITVLVDGTLFDLYPRPWSKLEEMAAQPSTAACELSSAVTRAATAPNSEGAPE